MDTDNLLVYLLKKAFEWDGIWFFLGVRTAMLLITLFAYVRVFSGWQGWWWAFFVAFAVHPIAL